MLRTCLGHRQCSVNRAPQWYFIIWVIPYSNDLRGGCNNPGVIATSLVMSHPFHNMCLIPESHFSDQTLLYLFHSSQDARCKSTCAGMCLKNICLHHLYLGDSPPYEWDASFSPRFSSPHWEFKTQRNNYTWSVVYMLSSHEYSRTLYYIPLLPY